MSLPITCPDFCTTSVPQMLFSNCSPTTRAGGVDRIYMANPDEINSGTFDWADPADWAAKISNTATALDSIRELTVLGDKPAPEVTERTISDNRKSIVSRAHTLNFTIDDITLENYEWVRSVQCGSTFAVWYTSDGGNLLFGGQDGVQATINTWLEIPRDNTELMVINGSLSWTDKNDPAAIANPIA